MGVDRDGCGGAGILVVGGGPAGMMAALAAARAGGRVTLLEKNAELGQKLLLTGNGRCNLTNQTDRETLVSNTPGNGRFLSSAFSRFGPDQLRQFLRSHGLPTTAEPDGRVFPAAGGARQVLLALRRALARCGVIVRPGEHVEALVSSGGRVTGVRSNGGFLPARAVVIATGGLSYPATGSTGDGYRLAVAAGHRIVPLRPSLVPLIGSAPWAAGLQGVSLQGVRARLRSGRTILVTHLGDLVFTHEGVSGPLVLRLSRTAVPCLAEGMVLELVLDFTPAMRGEDLARTLCEAQTRNAGRAARKMLDGLLPARLGSSLVIRAGIAPDKPAHQVTRAERDGLCHVLQHLPLTITGHRPLAEAQVTMGGVAVMEVDPRTMASRLLPGLYFAGEILDLDGYSGGFNLQIAFSTGFVAGRAARAAADAH